MPEKEKIKLPWWLIILIILLVVMVIARENRITELKSCVKDCNSDNEDCLSDSEIEGTNGNYYINSDDAEICQNDLEFCVLICD